MTVSKKQNDAVNRYKSRHYKRVPLEIPIADVPALEAAAAAAGQAVSAYIKTAIRQRMEREQAGRDTIQDG